MNKLYPVVMKCDACWKQFSIDKMIRRWRPTRVKGKYDKEHYCMRCWEFAESVKQK